MKLFKIALILTLFPIVTATIPHKFYVSTTMIEYVQERQSIQIITKIFIDDVEDVLQQRYDPSVSLASDKETEADANYLKNYILQKLVIKVNGKPAKLDYIGKEYDSDIVKSYIEIVGVSKLNSIEIENKLLMDLFDEQQNIIHIKTENGRRSLMLEKENPKGLLNFN